MPIAPRTNLDEEAVPASTSLPPPKPKGRGKKKQPMQDKVKYHDNEPPGMDRLDDEPLVIKEVNSDETNLATDDKNGQTKMYSEKIQCRWLI
jgi:hypothetical protein